MRDLTGLTISKPGHPRRFRVAETRMDSYLMIAVLELGCCLDLLVHGVIHVRSAQSAPLAETSEPL